MFSKGNINKLMKQAKDMQDKMLKAQQELEAMEIEGNSGGGAVKVILNGKKEILSLVISPDLLKDDKEMLEDLIISAVNKALTKAQTHSQEKMNNVTGGMISGLKIPGI